MAPYMNHFNLLQTISLLYFFFTLTSIGSSLSHDEECSALFQFKQSLIHQDDEALCGASWFQTFHSWKPTNNASDAGFDCCSWYGVECSNDHEYVHVISLDLSERSLCGLINSNSTLFSLVHLQRLNLAFNYFYESQIPSEIAHLKQLRSLNLSHSGFSGQVPNEISQLMLLSSLALSGNSLNLHNPSGFKNLVQNLTGLEELHLSGVDISSSVPHFLANFSSLRSIRLQNCLLQDEFPAAIFQLHKLKILDLSFNTNLIGAFVEFRNSSSLEIVNLRYTSFSGILPESISNPKNLTVLCLTNCSFSGHIPGSLSNMTQLTKLALGGNKFAGFVPSLVSLSKLVALELSDSRFDKGVLPNWLGMMAELNELVAYDMDIIGEIPAFLANLTKLSNVAIGRNSFTGHIPSWLFNLTQLSFIDLQRNQLQGPISSSFSNLKSLQLLDFEYNNFSGSVILDMFLGLDKLETLVLGHNMISLAATNNYTNSTLPELKILALSTCNLKEFPAFLRFQNKMELLFLNRNKIDGMVPVWIWNNSKETLHAVDLSHNSITGFQQHPQFLPWSRLQIFLIKNNQLQGKLPIPPQTTVVYVASDNNLTGEIPPLICELKSLRALSLTSNNMSGHLPPCVGKLSNSLVLLDLSINNFQGIMMNEFMHGSLLEYIDLSKNQFTGELPRSLTNCTNLEFLNLGDNSFHDGFPSWLGNLPNLQVLSLRANKFYGLIQSSTTVSSQFPKLRIIDLSNNNFNGQLHPKYFQTWNSMKSFYDGESIESFTSTEPYTMTIIQKGFRTEHQHILNIFTAIKLSSNHFEGEIPLSLKDLRGLQALDLSNNHFTGGVLPSLGYLKNLQVLDLSQNNLSGEIPKELLQLNILSIFNVSFNNLDGRIPQGNQFATFENDSYMGNLQLCGRPLSKECQSSKASRLPPTSNTYESESLLPNEIIDWIFVSCGVGSGLVFGIVIGNFLYERYRDRFTKMKDRWIRRPLHSIRRNQGSGGVIASRSKGKEKA
ncbi:unnamed protein product [Lactuca saligna]|uniref:Leucine-rich repeat-containing N-terminal plant-type domain-containing protein n=1 Tax=Lactuca saligna TaxID=75948 RepID=A0AA35ZNL3_LACSI|nr:unnamed protein product [Lactuca saligna]